MMSTMYFTNKKNHGEDLPTLKSKNAIHHMHSTMQRRQVFHMISDVQYGISNHVEHLLDN